MQKNGSAQQEHIMAYPRSTLTGRIMYKHATVYKYQYITRNANNKLDIIDILATFLTEGVLRT